MKLIRFFSYELRHFRITRKAFVFDKDLILRIAFLMLFIPLLNCSQPHESQSKLDKIDEQIIELKDIKLLQVNSEHEKIEPQKILCEGNRCFILDGSQKTVNVYSPEECSLVIGSQEDDEIQSTNVTSFTRSNNKTFIYYGQGKIEIFDKNGIYINSIILDFPKTIGELSDFCVGNGFVYAAFSYGDAIVKRFNLSGAFVDDFITGGEMPKPPTVFLANLTDIYLLPNSSQLILFSRLNGTVKIYNTNTKKQVRIIERYDTITNERVKTIKRSIKTTTEENSDFRVLAVTIMRSSILPQKTELIAIPSQKTAKRENWRHYFYSINLLNGNVKKKRFRFSDRKSRFPLMYCFSDKNIFYINDKRKIYYGGLK